MKSTDRGVAVVMYFHLFFSPSTNENMAVLSPFGILVAGVLRSPSALYLPGRRETMLSSFSCLSP